MHTCKINQAYSWAADIFRLIIVIICILFNISSCNSHAAKTSLFQSIQVVGNENLKTREVAFKKGLSNVIYTLTGNSNILNDMPIRQALNNAKQYVTSYSYKILPASFPFKLSDVNDGAITTVQRELHIGYDHKSIVLLLKKNNYPVWLSERPNVLVWFALMKKNNDNTIISDSTDSSLKNILADQFSKNRLILNFPIMDFEDIANISSQTLTTLSTADILKASLRYNTPAVLVVKGKLSAGEDDIYSGKLSFIFQGKTYQQLFSELNPQELSDTALSLVIKPMAFFYGADQLSSANQVFTIKIQNINSLQTYENVVRYLQRHALISTITPMKITSNAVVFKINVNKPSSQVIASFALDQHLIPVADETSHQDSDTNGNAKIPEKTFRWYP